MSPETKKKILGALVAAVMAGIIAFLAKLVEALSSVDLSMLDLPTSLAAAMATMFLS